MRDEGGTNEGSYGLQFDNEVISFTLIDLDRSGRLAVRVSECNPKGVSRTKFFLPSEVDAYQVEITNDLSFHHAGLPELRNRALLNATYPVHLWAARPPRFGALLRRGLAQLGGREDQPSPSRPLDEIVPALES